MPALRRLTAALAAGLLLAAGACDQGAPAAGETVKVPSGRVVQVLDVITDTRGTNGAAARFRFVVPDLKASEDWSADMQALCDSYALPLTKGMVPAPQQIVIALADRAVPFGEAAPEAVQFFESYAIQSGSCIWEMF
ncbi:DUF6497 family protein [Rhodobacter sp. Har01]|uniref:DUF6497 family protein n=1 Tax=Rhodobacter sp. Har01 TaxID=2883999 RepID=UPI001D0662BA|nr:DUF6497 family protein [Rhodobacter sp. Har01]MCB6179706.1 DUF6497 family protein [Rhodobacter sp. Har01]